MQELSKSVRFLYAVTRLCRNMKPVSFATVSIILILALLVLPALASVDRVDIVKVDGQNPNVTIATSSSRDASITVRAAL